MGKKVISFIRFSIFLVLLHSCEYKMKDAQEYLPGRYFYEIPSGEYQVLTINTDFTFKQVVYSKNKRVILYKNAGKMYVDGNNIEFEHWLECYELSDQKMLLEPHVVYSIGNYWEKLKNKDVLIVKFDQTGYIFKKYNN